MPGRGEPGADVQIPGQEQEVNSRAQQDQPRQVVEQRQRPLVDPLDPVNRAGQAPGHERDDPKAGDDPHEDRQRLDDAVRPAHHDLGRTEDQHRHPHADQQDADEDRAVQRFDQLLVELGPRAPGQPEKDSAQQQLDELGQGQ